ncbi:ABC transporter [Cyclobacterium lianum]|uniref:ABC transporter n=1 Tax=Cyclobacterium lianum TaxID=388280 RepID=A0A1M7MAF9_9BACT|nr:ATP-binding cassette domain-containing protein [Cyclobacterium lianum]SHM87685.1 ABC transporter [Cyclobacterium lianum]
MLEAKNIHFCINNKPIVDQVSINLKPGEITVLLGPNGAGKSTLFRLLSGEIKCKLGSVRYNGRSINTLAARELALLSSGCFWASGNTDLPLPLKPHVAP